MIPPCKPIFDQDMIDAALNALRNEKFVMGESVRKFEEAFAKYCGVDYAISTSSGTFALQATLSSLGVRDGAEAITTPSSFIATSNAVLHAGGKPVFSEIDLRTFNIDPSGIEKKITGKTKAILPVHLYGTPCFMDEINAIAEKRGIAVVEDACQAHGATYMGKKAGSLGRAGCFSFYSTKNLTVCGDGGMVTTNDKKLADAVAKIRDCGRKSQYEHDVLGYTSRLNTVNAAIGLVQLRRLDSWNEERRKVANQYYRELREVRGIALPRRDKNISPSYHLFSLMCEKRDELREHLKKHDIGTLTNYPIPIHLQPIYKEMFGYKEGDFVKSEKLSREVLCLPMYPGLAEKDVKFVCDKIKGFVGS